MENGDYKVNDFLQHIQLQILLFPAPVHACLPTQVCVRVHVHSSSFLFKHIKKNVIHLQSPSLVDTVQDHRQ